MCKQNTVMYDSVSWAYISDGRGRMGGDESARKWGGSWEAKSGEGGNMGVRFYTKKVPKKVPKEPRKRWSGGKKPVKIRLSKISHQNG